MSSRSRRSRRIRGCCASKRTNIVESTSADFRRLVGLDPEAPFDLAAALGPASPGTPVPPAQTSVPAFGAAFDLARASRAERKALQFRIDAAVRARQCRISRKPADGLGARRVRLRPAESARFFRCARRGSRRGNWAVHVRWSFFDGGRVHAETAEAAPPGVAGSALEGVRRSGAGRDRANGWPICDSARASIEAARSGVRCGNRSATRAGRTIRRRRRDQHRRAERAGRAAAGRARSDPRARQRRARAARVSTAHVGR